MSNLMNRVFVYGTLKGANHVRGLARFPGAEFIAQATTAEGQYKMLDLGPFPAVMAGGDADVLGEIWEVDDHTFEVLDQIEGYPDFYNRKIVNTNQGEAWMYYFVNNTEVYENVQPRNGILEWV